METNINRFEQSACKLRAYRIRTDSRAAANMGLAKAGGQWLIKVLRFYFTLVLGDRLVLLNARLRQAPNR